MYIYIGLYIYGICMYIYIYIYVYIYIYIDTYRAHAAHGQREQGSGPPKNTSRQRSKPAPFVAVERTPEKARPRTMA